MFYPVLRSARFIFTAILALSFTLPSSPSDAEEPKVIPAPQLGKTDGADPYLWHVKGLAQGSLLDVYSGAGPRFRIIHMLTEGTPVERLNCKDSRGGYWCRIATVDRPRISGWVDGRFLYEDTGFALPDDLRNPSTDPVIVIDPLPRPPHPPRP